MISRKPDMSPNGMPAAEGLVAYFGYGSLVNRATHRTAIVDAFPARLRGWRRAWRPRPDMPGFPAALLTVVRDDTAVCDGLLVIDHAQNLAAVDAREARYNRIGLSRDMLDLLPETLADCAIHVYAADAKLPPHREPPRILQSYLDAVMQGFLHVHGEDGLRRFVIETENFDTVVLTDRSRPLYPRAVDLPEIERELFDRLLKDHGVAFADT